MSYHAGVERCKEAVETFRWIVILLVGIAEPLKGRYAARDQHKIYAKVLSNKS